MEAKIPEITAPSPDPILWERAAPPSEARQSVSAQGIAKVDPAAIVFLLLGS